MKHFLLGVIALNCVSLPAVASTLPDLTYRTFGASTHLRQISVTNNAKGTVVSDKVNKRNAGPLAVIGHLDLIVKDATGRQVAKYTTNYTPTPCKPIVVRPVLVFSFRNRSHNTGS